jgi:hypothetical protein
LGKSQKDDTVWEVKELGKEFPVALCDRDFNKAGTLICGEAFRINRDSHLRRLWAVGDFGKASVTDGPFAETKECLPGFHMVEAKDLDEAIQIASRMPPAGIGSIEVRPVRPIREAPNAHRT